MYAKMKRLLFISLISVILPFISACDGAGELERQLVEIDIMLENNPDSALMLIKTINQERLSSPKLKAKHSLLHSIALDKNYIDLKTDSIIAPAVKYYMNRGSLNDRFRCHYYEARIYENADSLDRALLCAAKAEALDTSRISADMLCLLYSMKGAIYKLAWQEKQALESYKLARKYALKAEKFRHYAYYCLRIASCYNQDSKSAEAQKFLEEAKVYQQYFSDYENHLYHDCLINVMLDTGVDSEEILNFIDNYLSIYPHNEKINWRNIARVYLSIGDAETALAMLKRNEKCTDLSKEPGHYGVLSNTLVQLGDYKGALEAFIMYSRINDAHDMKLHRSEIKLVEKSYRLENEDLKKKHRIVLISIVCLLLIILLTYVTYLLLIRRREKDILLKDLDSLRNEYEVLGNTYKYLTEQVTLQEANAEIISILSYRLKALSAFLVNPVPDSLSKVAGQLDSLKKHKNYIVDNIGMLYAVKYPEFIGELRNHGLSPSEIGYCCLYLLGLNIPEAAIVIGKVSSIYNVNSAIRKKLHISTNSTNLDKWLTKRFSELYSNAHIRGTN